MMCCWYSEWRVVILSNIIRGKRMNLFSTVSKQHEKPLPSAQMGFPLVLQRQVHQLRGNSEQA